MAVVKTAIKASDRPKTEKLSDRAREQERQVYFGDKSYPIYFFAQVHCKIYFFWCYIFFLLACEHGQS